jgi:siroheme synthase
VTVYLVGAGPGDAGLITVRGAELLRRADAVVFDRLVHPSLLELAPAGAELHDVGKRPGARASQEGINELLVELGRRHAVVVRLKGGDPFIFGRGGEETLALSSAHLPFEVVPGVSAVNGVPA